MSRRAPFITILVMLFATFPVQASDILGPPVENGPVVVDIGFYLSDINDISEDEETFEFEGILTLQWLDERQAFDPVETGFNEKFYQGNFQFSEIFNGWWPQIYLANESGKYDRQGMMLRIASSGLMTYIEEVDAIAETRMELRRFPFDTQNFEAIFEVLGFDRDEVVLRDNPELTGQWDDEFHQLRVPQWYQPELSTSVREYDPIYGGKHQANVSAFVLHLDITRNPGYMIRLVLFPLTFLVMLSWSVFWMNRSSLGDRMDISFIGILTVVAYQIMFSGLLPKISYLTMSSAFLIISFLMMCASVVINLIVGRVDQEGRFAVGEQIDARCRYLFPIAYFATIAIVWTYIYLTT